MNKEEEAKLEYELLKKHYISFKAHIDEGGNTSLENEINAKEDELNKLKEEKVRRDNFILFIEGRMEKLGYIYNEDKFEWESVNS